jgi:general secretion pathway protein F
LSAEEIIELTDQDAIPASSHVHHAVKAGLPLESGIRALAEQTRSRTARRALLRLSEQLEHGVPLATALEESRAGLPRPMCALVEAGLEAGRLDGVMQFCVEQAQRSISLRQQVWMFLAYPMFLLWFAMVICGTIMLLMPRQFKKIFDDFGTELPGLTVVMIQLSDAMNSVGTLPWLILALIGPVVAISFMVFGSSRSSQRWSTSIPVIGRCFRYAALNDLCRLLALLAESGLPLPRALRFAGSASEDQWLSRQCQLIAMDIEDGSPPATAVMMADLPSSLGQVFRTARSEKTFAEALRGLADIFAAQCFVSSQVINSVIAPFAVAAVLGLFGITTGAMFLPLIKLLNDLS